MPRSRTRRKFHRYSYQAFAKLNLTLDILGRRDDGFHNVMTVMQTIDLSDRLLFATRDGSADSADALQLQCGRSSLQSEANLVMRAARLMQDALCKRGRFAPALTIELRKRIPVAAGLGGGSSDAARTLSALNEIWQVGLSSSELEQLAATLGSDVPFFLYGGTMLAEGRGEVLTPLPSPPPLWVVLLRPPIHVSDKTRRLYTTLQPGDYSSGAATRAFVSTLQHAPEMLTPDWWKQWATGGNAFAPIWERIAPRIATYRQAMYDAGAEIVLMSGAGPTIYTLTTGEHEAHSIQLILRERGMTALLARFIR